MTDNARGLLAFGLCLAMMVANAETLTGHIGPGVNLTKNLTISQVENAVFMLYWNDPESNLDLTLVSPTLERFDHAKAMADPAIEFAENPDFEYYAIDNPQPGLWIAEIRSVGTVGVDYNLVLETEGTSSPGPSTRPEIGLIQPGKDEIEIELSSPEVGYGLNESIRIIAKLTQEGEPLLGALVKASVLRPDSEEDKLLMTDDGIKGDDLARDGNYTAIYEARVEGYYFIKAQASGATLEGEGFRADSRGGLTVSAGIAAAEIEGVMGDRAVDVDGDGLFDHLAVEVAVVVNEPGEYSLQGWLYDSAGRDLGWTIDHGSFGQGNYTMRLDFDGRSIRESGTDGPYTLDNISLTGKNWTPLEGGPAYVTSPYRVEEFVNATSTTTTSPAIESPNQMVTISGLGEGEFDVTISTSKTLPVAEGRYRYDLEGVMMPDRPNNFTVVASGVKNLNIGLKKLQGERTRIWVTETIASDDEGRAVAQSPWVSPGLYDVRIFGDAAPSATLVVLDVSLQKPIRSKNGTFLMSFSTEGLPPGQYNITTTARNGSFCFDRLDLLSLPVTP